MSGLKFTIFLCLLVFCHPSTAQETVTDVDGNIYATAVFGDKVWMLENLRTTTLNDGQEIEQYEFDVGGSNEWQLNGASMPMFIWPDTSDTSGVYEFDLPIDFYGALYSFGSIASDKLAPTGWRVATEQDFIELETFVANDGNEGSTARALRGVSDWPSLSPGLDTYGFKALPSGFATPIGITSFSQLSTRWGTTDVTAVNGVPRQRVVSIFLGSNLQFSTSDLNFGNAVRCVKDVMNGILGDINGDGLVNLLDVGPFVDLLSAGTFVEEGDLNQDGVVNLLDIGPFIELLSG